MNEYLTPPELHQLTGFARANSQAAWLQDKNVPHRQDGRRVIVSRVHVQAWLEGRNVVTSNGPNWASVK